MKDLNLNQIEFAANACTRQQSGEVSVYHMCRAILLAQFQSTITMQFFLDLGRVVNGDPTMTFRAVPVHHGKTFQSIGVAPDQIIPQLGKLLDADIEGQITPEEFVKEFLDIHPLEDGNGRSAAIMYNMIRGTLDNPAIFPDFYKEK